MRTEPGASVYEVRQCMTTHWPQAYDWSRYGATAYPEQKDGEAGVTIYKLKERVSPTIVFYKVKTIACLVDGQEVDRTF